MFMFSTVFEAISIKKGYKIIKFPCLLPVQQEFKDLTVQQQRPNACPCKPLFQGDKSC